jgi:hypothetical protein
MGSVHMKEGCRGIVKKAFLRSRTKKKEVWGGFWERRVYGLGITG